MVGWVIWEFVVKTQVSREFTALIDKGDQFSQPLLKAKARVARKEFISELKKSLLKIVSSFRQRSFINCMTAACSKVPAK